MTTQQYVFFFVWLIIISYSSLIQGFKIHDPSLPMGVRIGASLIGVLLEIALAGGISWVIANVHFS